MCCSLFQAINEKCVDEFFNLKARVSQIKNTEAVRARAFDLIVGLCARRSTPGSSLNPLCAFISPQKKLAKDRRDQTFKEEAAMEAEAEVRDSTVGVFAREGTARLPRVRGSHASPLMPLPPARPARPSLHCSADDGGRARGVRRSGARLRPAGFSRAGTVTATAALYRKLTWRAHQAGTIKQDADLTNQAKHMRSKQPAMQATAADFFNPMLVPTAMQVSAAQPVRRHLSHGCRCSVKRIPTGH